MIDWDKPYGQHYGSRSAARFTQDGKDYDAQGRELDKYGKLVEEPEVPEAPEPEEAPVVEETPAPPKKPGVGPQDYKKLKERIGEEAYDAMKGSERKAAILEFKNAQ